MSQFEIAGETMCWKIVKFTVASRPRLCGPRTDFSAVQFYSAHGKQFCPIINRTIVGGTVYVGAFHTSHCNGNQIEASRDCRPVGT